MPHLQKLAGAEGDRLAEKGRDWSVVTLRLVRKHHPLAHEVRFRRIHVPATDGGSRAVSTRPEHVVEALLAGISAHSADTGQHSIRVAEYAVQLATAAGLSDGELEIIRVAGLLHDFGKIALCESFLSRSGPLSESELVGIRHHPETGYKVLSCFGQLRGAATLVRSHHERWDGTGYPRNLRCEDIPLGSRVIAVADAFDAMTTERPYKRALDWGSALRNVGAGAGTQFDPELAKVFVAVMEESGFAARGGDADVQRPHRSAAERGYSLAQRSDRSIHY